MLKSIYWVKCAQKYKKKKKKSLLCKEFDPDGKNRLKVWGKFQVASLHGIVQGVVINLQEKTSHQHTGYVKQEK